MKQKYCLKSTVSFKDVNTSHTNRSKSKQTFSFSKSRRFETIKPTCQKNTYQRQIITRKNSGISIGKSKRPDFTPTLNVSPGVAKYHLTTLFNQTKSKQNGYSLGTSREKIVFGSYINKELMTIPSSDRYNYNKKQKVQSPVYSLRSRTKILDKSKTLESQNNYPGPGYYQNPQINYNSKIASKFKNIRYSSSKSQRFQSLNNSTPGPGNYKQVSPLSNIGKYVVSNHIGGTKAIIGHQKKKSEFDQISKLHSNLPGPGYYRLPSEFGHYDGGVYKNYQTNRSSRVSRRMTVENN